MKRILALGSLLVVACSDDQASMLRRKPDLTTTIADFCAEHMASRLTIGDKYAGKIIEADGVLSRFDLNNDSRKTPYGHLEAPRRRGPCFATLTFLHDQVSKGEKLADARVRVRCKYDRWETQISMKDCIFLEP